VDAGSIGGIVGSIIGILGGLAGTYCSIRNTKGPLEKAFMIKVSLLCWLAVAILLFLIFIIPKPYNYLLWIPYGVLLPLAIIKSNKIQAEIRRRENEP